MKITRIALAESQTLPYYHDLRVKCSQTNRTLKHDAIQAVRRSLHTSRPKDAAFPLSPTVPPRAPSTSSDPPSSVTPLSSLPLSQVLRTYFITSVSSSPILLSASTSMLRRMLESRNPLFRIDRNPIMRAILWETFYKQFCAGETALQISRASKTLREQGYAGVILEYALEVLQDTQSDELQDVAIWRQGMLDSINMSAPGDFVGLKWSGMGPAAMRRMKEEQPPSKEMKKAMNDVCNLAAEKDICLLPAAEETWSLNGFHKWCLDLQRVHNIQGTSVVYTTYQAYLKQTPQTLSTHLAQAEREGFTLGVKLVRGAYLATEKRDLIHPTIEDTHHAYDTMMSAILHRRYNELLRPSSDSPSSKGTTLPDLNFVIASHNAISVHKAQEIRRQQAVRGEKLTPTVFAQLQGMADEVSCSLIAAGKSTAHDAKAVQERVLKCTTWGTMHQCLNYLLRRAAENKDAASRTVDTRKAMQAELMRRFKAVLSLGY